MFPTIYPLFAMVATRETAANVHVGVGMPTFGCSPCFTKPTLSRFMRATNGESVLGQEGRRQLPRWVLGWQGAASPLATDEGTTPLSAPLPNLRRTSHAI